MIDKEKDTRGEQVSWRIPLEIRAEIEALAADDLRTINAEVIVLLREAVAARKAAKKGSKS
jgi:hypothetical protein